MRKTKIICTIGPASDDPAVFRELCLSGMNTARLNFSHGTHEEHQVRIDMIKRIREELDLPVSILLDTKGPEYRIGTFENHEVFVKEGDDFTLTTRQLEGNEAIVSVSYKDLNKDLVPGDVVLINNGLVKMVVDQIKDTEILCKVEIGGRLSNRKSMSFPGKVLKQAFLSEQDKSDLLFGIKNDVDFVAASFVSTAEDIRSMREFLNENGGSEIALIAKIENQSGIDHVLEICEYCEGIMVARGDLGVEIDYSILPSVQKGIINKCRLLGQRVITATEMLESMIYQPRPTRAEISDVANAVYDGTTAVMLSGETASGKYPVEAVRVMNEVVAAAEKNINYAEQYINSYFKLDTQQDAFTHAICGMAMDVGAKAIAVSSITGNTIRMVSRFRPAIDIVGLATNKKAWYRLSLCWGVVPVRMEEYDSLIDMLIRAMDLTKETLDLQEGDAVILTGGANHGKSGSTNLLMVENV